MKQSRSDPPAIYAIWAEARPDGPSRGGPVFYLRTDTAYSLHPIQRWIRRSEICGASA